VLSVSVAGVAPVYSLTVEGEHEYFANGVLCRNCDALRYWAINFRWFDREQKGTVSDFGYGQQAVAKKRATAWKPAARTWRPRG
jgi:hypothetical protein